VSDPGPEPLGLYVHVPFCEAKCSYCHFAIDPRRPDEARQERYVRAVLAEMASAVAGVADTLYFGGGTPSLVASSRLARVVGEARRRFALPLDAEVTVEANPRDLDEAGYRALLEMGANRISLGVQSLDDAVLRAMGRLHTAANAITALEQARRAGFGSVSVDLILGWPGESAERWRRNLDGIRALAPEHLSLYVLELEGRTALSHEAARGRLDLPDEDLVADLYAETVPALEGIGLRRYEISNFARAGFESRHNAKYWDDQPFLGFGLSAHSYREGRRWWNHDTFVSYCAAVETRGAAAAVAGERRLDARERAAEAAFTGLRRREGVDLPAFRRRYGTDLIEAYGDDLRRSLAAGLLEHAGERLRLTERGVLLSNEVFQAFV
jgi:putative oxygen-independent coproporphyrinogen III oxidase